MLNKKFLAAALAFAAIGAHAQSSGGGLRPFVGGGLTFGGDQIGSDIQYRNSDDSTSVYAGGLFDMRGGLEYQTIGSPWSFQASLGYHVDYKSADNGSVSFSRWPLEVLTHYAINPSWRIGGGLRKALGAESSTSGAGYGWIPDAKYNSSVGYILEVETFFGRSVGLKIRAVNEEYKFRNGGNAKYDGTHLGVIGVYYLK